MGMPLYEK